MKTFLRGSVAATVLLASSAFAAEPVVIVTSFPDTMTTVIEKAFEEAHPEYDLEVLNKSTSSGVKYIQEIAGSNTGEFLELGCCVGCEHLFHFQMPFQDPSLQHIQHVQTQGGSSQTSTLQKHGKSASVIKQH